VEPEPHPPQPLPQQEAPSDTPQAVVAEAAPCVVTTPIKPPHHVRRGKSVQGDSQHEPCSTPDMPASTTLVNSSPAYTGTRIDESNAAFDSAYVSNSVIAAVL